jgi:hypothetical protein
MSAPAGATTEAVVGGAEPAHLSAKLSNTLAHSNQIFDTYSPVREADRARALGIDG